LKLDGSLESLNPAAFDLLTGIVTFNLDILPFLNCTTNFVRLYR
jgi:hypothetical protein